VAVERDELVEAYWQHWRLGSSEDRDDRLRQPTHAWAWDEVERAVADRDGDVVELLVALADAAPDDAALAYLGAGPVEDLVRVHGEAVAAALERAAESDVNLRRALRSVWLDPDGDAAIGERSRRFGPPT
jgi:hypothetical protein